MLQTITIGVQSLPKVIAGGYLYVDKTEAAYRFVTGYPCVFISRPRRFGKSLMVSTLNEIFSGNKELFKGLWIYDKLDWAQYDYPVLRFDMAMMETVKTPLYESLERQLWFAANQYNITLESRDLGSMFRELILKTAAQSRTNQVVVLIDEYDAPITNYINDRQQMEAHATVLRSFYGILKGMDEYLRQVFITGITRYSRLQLFSSLNNILDLTMHEDFLSAFGYTQTELETYFAPHLQEAARKLNFSYPELLERVRFWYNGYSWDGNERVYNPFGIANFLVNNKLNSYWVITGVTRFLRAIIREDGLVMENLERLRVTSDMLDSIDYGANNGISLMFQIGFLTVDTVRIVDGEHRYTLRIPNEEIRRTINDEALIGYFKDGDDSAAATNLVLELHAALQVGKVETVIEILKIFFASIPYQLFHRREAYWHSVAHTILYAAIRQTVSEVSTNEGRVDTVVEADDFTYLFEYKTSGTASEALDQIREKHYAERYRKAGKGLICIGIVFDEAQHQITDWSSEQFPAHS